MYVLTSETVDDLGHAYLFNNPLDRPAVSGTETTVVRVERRDLIFPAYLNYLMSTPRFVSCLRQYVRGMKVFRVHPDDVARIEVELPPVDVQKQVVAILDALYEKQRVNARLNGYLEELCDALFLGFLERADSSWHEGTLEELAEVKYGKDHKKLADGPYPVYGSGGFMRSAEKSLFSGESVLIPRKGSLNNVMYVNEAFWTVDTMFFTVPRIPGAAKFLYQYVKRLDLASMNSGSAVPSMTTSILNALSLPVPPRDSLLSFNAKLQPMYDAVRANNLENRRLESLRDSLLPKLMSGEIDVSKIDLMQLNSHLVFLDDANVWVGVDVMGMHCPGLMSAVNERTRQEGCGGLCVRLSQTDGVRRTQRSLPRVARSERRGLRCRWRRGGVCCPESTGVREYSGRGARSPRCATLFRLS